MWYFKDGTIFKSGTKEEIEELQKYTMLHNGIDYIPVVFVTSEVALTKELISQKAIEIEDWVKDTYRPLFKGLRNGSMGDYLACVQKMAKFILIYKYTQEEILEATKRYLESFNGKYAYVVQADYFIFKQVNEDGTAILKSTLLTWLEDGVDGIVDMDLFQSIN